MVAVWNSCRHCPVTALSSWLEHANITTGPVSRAVDKWDRLQGPLARGEAVNMKRLATTARPHTPTGNRPLVAGWVRHRCRSSWRVRS